MFLTKVDSFSKISLSLSLLVKRQLDRKEKHSSCMLQRARKKGDICYCFSVHGFVGSLWTTCLLLTLLRSRSRYINMYPKHIHSIALHSLVVCTIQFRRLAVCIRQTQRCILENVEILLDVVLDLNMKKAFSKLSIVSCRLRVNVVLSKKETREFVQLYSIN